MKSAPFIPAFIPPYFGDNFDLMDSTRPPLPSLNSARRDAQAGNALFIILIAVALFAALSYAITTTDRGSGTIEREESSLNAAQLVQYTTTVRAAVDRMLLTGTAVADLQFCADGPGTCIIKTLADFCTSGADCVFAPEGGGVTPQLAPEGWGALSADRGWEIVSISFTGVGTSDNDLSIRIFPTDQDNPRACKELNKHLLGSTDIPNSWPDGKAVACYENPGGFLSLISYVHVLVEQ